MDQLFTHPTNLANDLPRASRTPIRIQSGGSQIKGKKAIVYIYQVQVVSKYLARALKDGPEQMINWVCE